MAFGAQMSLQHSAPLSVAPNLFLGVGKGPAKQSAASSSKRLKKVKKGKTLTDLDDLRNSNAELENPQDVAAPPIAMS